MAAGEDELEALVGEHCLVQVVVHGERHLEQVGLRGQRAVTADAVDRAIARGDHEPAARIRGDAVARPAFGSDCERLLCGLLGEIEIAEEADQGGDDASPLVAENLLEQCYISTSGRTSTAPPMRAAGMRAAIAIASSRLSASKRKKPPSPSLVSANGPSVVKGIAVSHAHGGCGVRRLQLLAADDAGALGDGGVLAVDRVPIVFREVLPLGVPRIDEECVLHGSSLE